MSIGSGFIAHIHGVLFEKELVFKPMHYAARAAICKKNYHEMFNFEN